MISLKKADNTVIEFLNLPVEFIEIYELVKDNVTIGYGVINKDENNMITIYVLEKYRGNGYGKILFEQLLEEVKLLGYKEIRLTFEKKNIAMKKIAIYKNALEVSIDKDKITYVVPI